MSNTKFTKEQIEQLNRLGLTEQYDDSEAQEPDAWFRMFCYISNDGKRFCYGYYRWDDDNREEIAEDYAEGEFEDFINWANNEKK